MRLNLIVAFIMVAVTLHRAQSATTNIPISDGEGQLQNKEESKSEFGNLDWDQLRKDDEALERLASWAGQLAAQIQQEVSKVRTARAVIPQEEQLEEANQRVKREDKPTTLAPTKRPYRAAIF